MKIGIWIPSVRPLARPDVIRRSIVQAEQFGYDSIWVIDHVIAPRPNAAQFGLLYDPLVVLSLAAGLTDRVLLGISVLVVPYRHGVLAAKMIASLDNLSGGRIILGVGSGWNAAEFAILGLPFEQRGPMTDEYLRVMRELWTDPEPALPGSSPASARSTFARGRFRSHIRLSGWGDTVPPLFGGRSSSVRPGTRSIGLPPSCGRAAPRSTGSASGSAGRKRRPLRRASTLG